MLGEIVSKIIVEHERPRPIFAVGISPRAMSTYSPDLLMPIRLAASEIEYASAVVSVNIFGSIGI
jgi:hypothetical protein